MPLKIFLFLLMILFQNDTIHAEYLTSEWIVYFSTPQAAENYQSTHPEKVLDQYGRILKMKLSMDEKNLLQSESSIELIEPNYAKKAATEGDPLFQQQWGLNAIHYTPNISTLSSKNQLEGKTISINNHDFIYDQTSFSANTFTIKAATKLSRISIELENHKGPWSLSIFYEGKEIGSNEGDLERLDVLIPKEHYEELTVVIENADNPTIRRIVGVNHTLVAVIDSGVTLHEDFGDTLLYSLGKNFKDGLEFPEDQNGHGTHVTGILAASTNNGIGIAGVTGDNPVDILPLKVLDKNGYGGDFEISKAVNEAVKQNVDLINMSIAGRGQTHILKEAIVEALQHGIPVVAAAGNWNSSTEKVYPASYPGVITVSAVTEALERVSTSNYGWEVDISAPGDEILSTYLNNQYKTLTGTSMATPFVSGTLAILKSIYPDMDVIELRNHLFLTSKDILAEGYDEISGYGLLDMNAALQGMERRKGLEWLSLKEGQELDFPEQKYLGISSKWAGKNVAVFVNDVPFVKRTITSNMEIVDFSQLNIGKNHVNLLTFVTDDSKKIYEVDQTIVRNSDVTVPSFSDVPTSFWAYEEISDASQKGLINGYSDGSFRPNANISRKHSVLILNRLFEWDNLDFYTSPFKDVESTLTSANYAIMAANHNGVIKGYKNGLFQPDHSLTRGQMALILARTLGLEDIKFKGAPHSFKDIKPGDETFDAVQHLTSLGIITKQNNYHPNAYITRAQFTAMITRINH